MNFSGKRSSAWARAHARHALILAGVGIATCIVLAILPLVVVGLGAMSNDRILWVYGISFLIDLAALGAFMCYAFFAARSAARGDASRR